MFHVAPQRPSILHLSSSILVSILLLVARAGSASTVHYVDAYTASNAVGALPHFYRVGMNAPQLAASGLAP